MNFPLLVPTSSPPRLYQDGRSDVLALAGITLQFGGITALDNISFTLRQREIRGVIGPNGAGKSSLVNIISGLYRPTQGRIAIDGKTFTHVPTDRLAHMGLARTFQNLALFPGLSVAQNIASGLAFTRRASLLLQIVGRGRARDEDRRVNQVVEQIADLLDLRALLQHRVEGLPYGLRKQVELARALAAHPRILLLDEPMAGLTMPEKTRMARHIRAARDEFGLAVILIEHDISVVMDLSDRIAVLNHGSLIADEEAAVVRRDPNVIRAYLGSEAA